jgi:hypothetical protein
MFEFLDFENLAIGISLAAKSNPVVALAAGIITGVLGKAFVDKKRSTAQEKKERKEIIDKIIDLRERQRDAKISE